MTQDVGGAPPSPKPLSSKHSKSRTAKASPGSVPLRQAGSPLPLLRCVMSLITPVKKGAPDSWAPFHSGGSEPQVAFHDISSSAPPPTPSLTGLFLWVTSLSWRTQEHSTVPLAPFLTPFLSARPSPSSLSSGPSPQEILIQSGQEPPQKQGSHHR